MNIEYQLATPRYQAAEPLRRSHQHVKVADFRARQGPRGHGCLGHGSGSRPFTPRRRRSTAWLRSFAISTAWPSSIEELLHRAASLQRLRTSTSWSCSTCRGSPTLTRRCRRKIQDAIARACCRKTRMIASRRAAVTYGPAVEGVKVPSKPGTVEVKASVPKADAAGGRGVQVRRVARRQRELPGSGEAND